MGRKLNLSHLSDDECRQVLAVIQRDFNVRQTEKDRILKIQGFVENEAQKRLVLSRQMEFNKKHCMCCFSTFGLIFNKKVKCEKCNFFICKDCMSKTEEDSKAVICLPCNQQRELQERACQWFYDQMKAKFRRFGSAKVVRSLYKRQSESGTSESEHNSDSGVDHPFSPLLKKGGAFKRDGSADTIDEETNTEVEESSAPAEVYSALLLRNPDWLKQFKPESESIGVQAPDDNLANGGKDYWGLIGEDSTDGGAERLKREDSDGTDSDVSSVEDEIAGLESSSAGKIMSSVYSLDNTTPFKVSTATYFLNQPDVDLFQSGMLEVKFPSDDLIAALKESNLQDISSLDARWGTVVVHRISHGDETDGDKTEFHWSEVIEQHISGGGNSETDENENAVGITDIDGMSSDSDASNEKYRSTYVLLVDPEKWKE